MTAPAAITASSRALTIVEAAAAMNVPPRVIRQWLRAGAPVVRPGHRGRGHTATVDVVALAAWVKARNQAPVDEGHRKLALAMIDDVAAIAVAAWRIRTDPNKVRDAAVVVSQVQLQAASICAHLGVPELQPHEWPENVRQLATFSRGAVRDGRKED